MLILEPRGIKDSIIDARDKGIKTRFITEITKDNISYCKVLVMLIDEVRHLDGIKGSFWINETEYIAPAALHKKGKAASQIIYSNVSELVEHQRYIFDTLWNKSMPSEERIREIDEGIVPRKSSGSAKSARRNKMCLEYDKGCERGCICDVLNC